MKTIIGKLFAKVRQKMFELRIEWEIYHKIFPHLNHERSHGYAFTTDEELTRARVRTRLEFGQSMDILNAASAEMPKAYAEAFRYIVYRDLNRRMEAYFTLAEKYIQPEECDPRFVAKKAN